MTKHQLYRACLGLTGPPADPLGEWQVAAVPLEPLSDLDGPQRVAASPRDCYGVVIASELQLLDQHSSPETRGSRLKRSPEDPLSLAAVLTTHVEKCGRMQCQLKRIRLAHWATGERESPWCAGENPGVSQCARRVAQMSTPLEPSSAGGEMRRPLRRAVSCCRGQRRRDSQSCWRPTSIK